MVTAQPPPQAQSVSLILASHVQLIANAPQMSVTSVLEPALLLNVLIIPIVQMQMKQNVKTSFAPLVI